MSLKAAIRTEDVPMPDKFEALKARFEAAPAPKTFVGHAGKVHSVGFNAPGTRLASGSYDKTARVWWWERSNTTKDSLTLRGHTGSVDQLRWDPVHPDLLATAGQDKTVRIWDTRCAFPGSLAIQPPLTNV